MPSKFSTIEEAVQAIRDGGVIIVVDAEDRENEGDFIFSDEKVTTETINLASDEFERRTRGPDKEDPIKVRKELEAFYGLNLRPQSMPYIRGANGQPTDVTQMDMAQSRKAVGKDHLSGKISTTEATRLINLLNEIQRQQEEIQ